MSWALAVLYGVTNMQVRDACKGGKQFSALLKLLVFSIALMSSWTGPVLSAAGITCKWDIAGWTSVSLCAACQGAP